MSIRTILLSGTTVRAELMAYSVYAIKYAQRDAVRSEHFLGGDPHENSAMPMDYFIWLISDANGRNWVVDTGFESSDARQRNRTLLRTAEEALALLEVKASEVADVILTHFHYDHAGGVKQFPNATFHVQDEEMAFATGRDMGRKAIRHAFAVEHIKDLVERVFDEKVRFHSGDVELAPGLSMHHVGGHTRGLQVVRVDTGSGIVVLASDATHYYENMDEERPFPIVLDVGKMIDGYGILRELAGEDGVIVPGHDPLVFERFPPATSALSGIAVSLHRSDTAEN
ncbi:MAG: N-acyl homoserine lactonase family protein [Actinomycetota bacterium]|nr:N-acyl homoserine lactonase family protein [Actinomycetota bacterium]